MRPWPSRPFAGTTALHIDGKGFNHNWFRLFQITKRAKTIGRSDDPGKHMGRMEWEYHVVDS